MNAGRPGRRALLRGLAGALALPATGALSHTPAVSPSKPMPQTSPPSADALPDDPYLWLEEVQGERALAWVRGRNAASEALLQAEPGYAALRAEMLEVLDSKDQIPDVTRHGRHLYNLWRDAANPRGLWRRATLDEYRKREPAWETVLDLDALARAEGENWVWGGATVLEPGEARALLQLSRGGADASVVREFDLQAKTFVTGPASFGVPEAKTSVEWVHADELLVASDFGPGSLTDSGYPRTLRRWRRGQPLADAPTVFEGEAQDVAVYASVDRTPGFERTVFGRMLDFYNNRLWLLGADGRLAEVAKPRDAKLAFWRERVLVELRSDWAVAGRSFPRGSLLVADAADWLAGKRDGGAAPQPLFTPSASRSLADWTTTRSRVLLNLLDDVASRVEELSPPATAGQPWQHRAVDAPYPGVLSVAALHDPLQPGDPLAEHYWLQAADFLSPDRLQLARTGSDARETLKQRPSFFDASGLRAEQRFATSRDGTRVPYFVLWPRGARPGDAAGDGGLPTLLYGYGGFEVAMTPFYSGMVGRAWLARGGVFVLANIRGGGEYGPAWHQAAVGANKQRSYDDFMAVAEDLVRQGITTPARLGIKGGSNGGLLVGAAMVQRPELFGAVVCQVPLLDMRRYHRLLAGASWMAEYGDPDDPAQWAFIQRYSPYHNVPPAARRKLPAVLFTTSTRDDRVHPGHARKMAARMAELGHAPLYWENLEGGHSGAADNAQRATMAALEYAFLWRVLGGRERRPD